MAKRFTDTDMWDKEWFMLLKPRLKCLVKFVRDKCDLAGVWSPNFIAAKMYVGEDVCEKDLLSIDNGNQFIKLENGKVYCVDFIKFQYGVLSEKSPVHRKVLGILKSHGFDPNRVLNTLSNTLLNTLKEEEEDKEEEKEVEKEEEKEQQPDISIWPSFDNFWDLYDKKIDRPKSEDKWHRLTQQQKEAIMAYVPDYKESQPDKQYRKNPLTFLNNLSWENEIIKSNGNSKTSERLYKNNELRTFSESVDKCFGFGENINPGTNSTIDTEATIIESNQNTRVGNGESFSNQANC